MDFRTHHVCIRITNLEESQKFYETALGFTVDTIIHHTPAITSCFMISADRLIRIQLLNCPNQVAEHTGYGHLGVQVADIQSGYGLHQSMGVVSQEIVEQPHQFGYFIKDPDGYETEICQLK